MRRRGRFIRLVLVAAVASAAGCGTADCAKSADIQVTVAAAGDVAVGAIAKLHVMLSVADGPQRWLDITPDHTITSSSAFILRPDPPPASKYDVSLTVQAFDGAGDLIAIGAESMQALATGCNRMTVHLASLPLPPPMSTDMALPPNADLAGMKPPPDLAGCTAGTPDEDTDGRANFCDLCPADYDPTPIDSDGDGLPDACDPDPTMPSNRLVYFEPFDVPNPNWSGDNANSVQPMTSYMTLDSGGSPNGVAFSSDTVDSLPLNVRVQTYVFPYQYDPQAPDVDTGLFVGTNANPSAPGTVGTLCILNSLSAKLELYRLQTNGTFMLLQSAPLPGGVQGTKYRLRLTQRGSTWTCESVLGMNPAVTVTGMQPVTAPLFMALRSAGSSNRFHSVVAETALP